MRRNTQLMLGAAALSLVFAAPAFAAKQPFRPTNDLFRSAQSISAAGGTVNGRNAAANNESGEPGHVPGNAGGASLWYRGKASEDRLAMISTAGSSVDTELAVHTGASLTGLASVAWNENIFATVWQSSVTFTLHPRTTYQIAVDGWWRPATGALSTDSAVLRWSLTRARPARPPHSYPMRGFQTGGRMAGAFQAANALAEAHYPYTWGGGHNVTASPSASTGPSPSGRNYPGAGYDCSGSVREVLLAAGYDVPELDASGFMSYGLPGPGAITIFADSSHVFMTINGRPFGTWGGQGPSWIPYMPDTHGFVARHPWAASGSP